MRAEKYPLNLMRFVPTKGKVENSSQTESNFPKVNFVIMEVAFNNSPIKIDPNKTLSEVLKDKDLFNKPGIAVAVNGKVVSKSDWDAKELQEKDSIIVITATAGG